MMLKLGLKIVGLLLLSTRSSILSSYLKGVKSEDLVAQHFESVGFSLIKKRYKTKYGEIDLILRKNQSILFVEVKSRNKNVSLDNVITQKQLMRNYSAAEFFLSENYQYQDYECQFDLVIVMRNKIFQHIKNINL